jgi:hypothetical protein
MARRRKDDDKGDGSPDRPRRRKSEGEQQYPPGTPDADPVEIHRAYVERRMSGGPPATEDAGPPTAGDAYARALEQWHRLPGAVSTPPTEVTGAELRSRETEAEEEEEEEEDGAGDDEELPA